jgi:hypothetical protein
MRYLVDVAVFVAIFVLGRMVFKDDFYALIAALIVASLAEVVQGGQAKR